MCGVAFSKHRCVRIALLSYSKYIYVLVCWSGMMTAMSRLFHSARRQGVQMMRLPIVASKDHQSDHHHALEPQAVCKLELKLGQACKTVFGSGPVAFMTAVLSLSMYNYKPDTDSPKQASKLTWSDQPAPGLYWHMPLIIHACSLTALHLSSCNAHAVAVSNIYVCRHCMMLDLIMQW